VDAHIVAANHAGYYARMMTKFLPNKSLERIGQAINWTNRYCSETLTGLIIDRNDPIVLRTKEEAYDQ